MRVVRGAPRRGHVTRASAWSRYSRLGVVTLLAPRRGHVTRASAVFFLRRLAAPRGRFFDDGPPRNDQSFDQSFDHVARSCGKSKANPTDRMEFGARRGESG